MEQKEILPCPFCGGAASLHMNDGPIADKRFQFGAGLYVMIFVRCHKCAAVGAPVEARVYDQGILSVVSDGAILKWNARAKPHDVDVEQPQFTLDDGESAEKVIGRARAIIRYAAPDGLHVQGEAMQVAAYLEAPNTLRQLLPILESLSTSEELKAVITT